MTREKIKLEEEDISKLLLADIYSEAGAEASEEEGGGGGGGGEE